MDTRYLGYAMAHSPFYGSDRRSQNLPLQFAQLPSGWIAGRSGPWEMWAPVDVELRQQGWKVHVSATPENAQRILDLVTLVCLGSRTPFKFIQTTEQLITRSAKSADRSASGKFIAIYPHNDAQLEQLVVELEARIGGFAGPYILSDIRYRQGPIYFRYGGFRPLAVSGLNYVDIACLVAPTGELVADERTPVFRMPTWVSPPQLVQASIDALRTTSTETPLDDYESLEALHFSNSGGVYKATSTSGHVSVLKEARPHAGLDRNGLDSTARLLQEASNLSTLEPLGIAPRVYRQFTAWEHQYLEVEFIEGMTLKRWNSQNHPFASQAAPPSIDLYTEDLLSALRGVSTAIDRSHAAEVVIGDLHPSNVLLRPDASIRLIDLEDGRHPDATTQAPFNAFGYEAPRGITAARADWYGFSRLIASAFYVATPIEVLAPEYWSVAREWIRRRFGREASSLLDYAQERSGVPSGGATTFTPTVSPRPWGRDVAKPSDFAQAARRSLAEGILASARFHPFGRPQFPGDIQQWERYGHFDAATGSAGVLLSLIRAGEEVPVDIIDRFESAALDVYKRMPLGLHRGVAGVASVLFECGRVETSDMLFDHLAAQLASIREVDLADGLAGIGLSLSRSAIHSDGANRLALARMVRT